MDEISLIPVKAFSDNYIWLAQAQGDADTGIVIVDPGDANPVLQMMNTLAITPCAVLITHHHYDHIDGIQELLKHYDVPVYGPSASFIPGLTRHVGEGDQVELDNGLVFRVLEVPGHTTDHIAYWGHQTLFCGDTLFAGGCGRLFEGSAEQMFQSLQKLAGLPDETRICCAHEYTLNNLEFALQVDTHNELLVARLEATRKVRLAGQPSLPSLLLTEKQTNPFLRCHDGRIQAAAASYANRPMADAMETFRVIRFWKDTW